MLFSRLFIGIVSETLAGLDQNHDEDYASNVPVLDNCMSMFKNMLWFVLVYKRNRLFDLTCVLPRVKKNSWFRSGSEIVESIFLEKNIKIWMRFLESHIDLYVLFLFILTRYLSLLSGFEKQNKFLQFGTRDSFPSLIKTVIHCVYM